jgi:hypothetical protein
MQLKKHNEVVTSLHDLDKIKQIILSKKWVIHKSSNSSANSFFNSNLTPNEVLFFNDLFKEYKNNYIDENDIHDVIFERAYINCHPSHHPGDWHTDNEYGFTLIYYPVSEVDFKDEGGIDIENNYEPYTSNSLCIFPANLKHRARMHTLVGILRYSIAFKYQTKNN